VSKLAKSAKTTLPTHPGPEAKPEELHEYNAAILRLAREGNEETVPQLRKWLAVPENVNRAGADLAYQVQASLAQKMAGTNLYFREAVVKNAENLRDEICGPNPSALERLLAERVATCWTYLNYLELIYTQSAENLTIAQGLYRQKVLDRAHGRYLSAIKTLADVRRLALPAVQVNIAKKQVNVTGGTSS
jgi:hypothetical protein